MFNECVMFLLYCIIVFTLCSFVIVCFLIQPLGCNINKVKTEPRTQNQRERRVIGMLLSMVSKAAERSMRQVYMTRAAETDR